MRKRSDDGWEARSRSHSDIDRDPDETNSVRRHQPVANASQGVVAQQHTSLADSIPIPVTSSSSDPSMEPRNLHLSMERADHRIEANQTMFCV